MKSNLQLQTSAITVMLTHLMTIKKSTYLIIGASAAGIAAAKKIRSLDPEVEIICFSAEAELPYNKCFLVDWLAHERIYDALILYPRAFYDEQRITLILNTRVVSIDPVAQTVGTACGVTYSYTKLLIATGAGPRLLPHDLYQGNQPHRIIPFYTLNDTQRIHDIFDQQRATQIVIIGGGISGLECADAIAHPGRTVTVLERDSQLASAHLLADDVQQIQMQAAQYGVTCLQQITVTHIDDQEAGVAIHCSDGRVIAADCVITAMGAVADMSLAQSTGLTIEQGGIATNSFLQTNYPNIFAAGDCATVTENVHQYRMRSCMWSDAIMQGMIAGTNMVMNARQYAGALAITVSHLFGLDVVSYQSKLLKSAKYRIETIRHADTRYTIAYDQNNVVVAFVAVGTEVSYTHIKRSLVTRTPYHEAK